jgi:hypothetical protein
MSIQNKKQNLSKSLCYKEKYSKKGITQKRPQLSSQQHVQKT